jgi:hypothetical protein
MDEITVEGKRYLSARRAAQISGYTQDYIGQLCRGKELTAKKIGRSWFVSEESLMDHLKEYKHQEWLKRRQLQKKQQEQQDQQDTISYEPDERPLHPEPQKPHTEDTAASQADAEPVQDDAEAEVSASEIPSGTAASAGSKTDTANTEASDANGSEDDTEMAIYHKRLESPEDGEHTSPVQWRRPEASEERTAGNRTRTSPGSDSIQGVVRPQSATGEGNTVDLGDGIRARRIDRHTQATQQQSAPQRGRAATDGIISDGIITNETIRKSKHVVNLSGESEEEHDPQSVRSPAQKPRTMGVYPEGDLPKTPEQDEDVYHVAPEAHEYEQESAAETEEEAENASHDIEQLSEHRAGEEKHEGDAGNGGDDTANTEYVPSVEADEYESAFSDPVGGEEPVQYESPGGGLKMTVLTGITIGIAAACGIVFVMLEWHATYAIGTDGSGATQIEGIRLQQW